MTSRSFPAYLRANRDGGALVDVARKMLATESGLACLPIDKMIRALEARGYSKQSRLCMRLAHIEWLAERALAGAS